ncbi:hypothetical protein E0F88_27355 [Dyadobacter psychrotolerans]|uniref:Uncharacterized protein n=2 Tax=Dyadobacter psychrotolerans TaxID=2541721 RepID=A0A4R5DJN6_9BACT|nr:hypothetical protein E0F88_27355 [Dyadobacter psychrotolerans]
MDFGLCCIILSASDTFMGQQTDLDSLLKIQTITTFKHPFPARQNGLNIASVNSTVAPDVLPFAKI